MNPSVDKPTQTPKASKRHVSIRGVHLRTLTFALALSAVAIVSIVLTLSMLNNLRNSYRRYQVCSEAADELMSASDELTTQARSYVTTGKEVYLNEYLDEVYIRQHRNEAIGILERETEGDEALMDLTSALTQSNQLATIELYAMRVAAEAYGLRPMPESLLRTHISPEDEALSDAEKLELSKNMVLGEDYDTVKSTVIQNVSECTNDLIKTLEQREHEEERNLAAVLTAQGIIVALLVGIVAYDTVMNNRFVISPLSSILTHIQNNEPLEEVGSSELMGVVESYNLMYEKNRERTELLKHKAETDGLTGLYNRGSYDQLLAYNDKDVSLLIMDVDLFKTINDTYGHSTGDEVLKKVAASLVEHFRTTDYPCRIGGDEFAVLMTNMSNVPRTIITHKLDCIAEDLVNTSDGLPRVTLSIGIALSNELPENFDLYHAADKALYEAKRSGRNQYVFFA